MKDKKKLITLVAVITAIIGATVALAALLKRKAKDIGEKLDYDGSLYYEDDDPLDEDDFLDIERAEASVAPADDTFSAGSDASCESEEEQ